jgi:hypothetical protein
LGLNHPSQLLYPEKKKETIETDVREAFFHQQLTCMNTVNICESIIFKLTVLFLLYTKCIKWIHNWRLCMSVRMSIHPPTFYF